MIAMLTHIARDEKGNMTFLKSARDLTFVGGLVENSDRETELFSLDGGYICTVAEAFDTVYKLYLLSREAMV